MKISKMFDNIEEFIIILSMFIMVIITFGNVCSRYIFHMSWSFSGEIVVMFFVYNSLFGAAIAYKRGLHLGFNALINSFSPQYRKIIIIFTTIITILLVSLLAKYGTRMVIDEIIYKQTTPALGMPAWIQGISVPLGSIFIIIRVIQSCFKELRKF